MHIHYGMIKIIKTSIILHSELVCEVRMFKTYSQQLPSTQTILLTIANILHIRQTELILLTLKVCALWFSLSPSSRQPSSYLCFYEITFNIFFRFHNIGTKKLAINIATTYREARWTTWEQGRIFTIHLSVTFEFWTIRMYYLFKNKVNQTDNCIYLKYRLNQLRTAVQSFPWGLSGNVNQCASHFHPQAQPWACPHSSPLYLSLPLK